MKPHLLAAALAAALASTAAAQPPTPTPVAPPPPSYFGPPPPGLGLGGPPGLATVPQQPLPPIPPARWMFSGPPGVFLYDSGNYLLGGFEGLSRSTGAFTMGYPGGYGFPAGAGYGVPAPAAPCRGCFRR
jgi:hypothetical protein